MMQLGNFPLIQSNSWTVPVKGKVTVRQLGNFPSDTKQSWTFLVTEKVPMMQFKNFPVKGKVPMMQLSCMSTVVLGQFPELSKHAACHTTREAELCAVLSIPCIPQYLVKSDLFPIEMFCVSHTFHKELLADKL